LPARVAALPPLPLPPLRMPFLDLLLLLPLMLRLLLLFVNRRQRVCKMQDQNKSK